ncbi:hypothetical protein OSB04_026622 [Centaurea solstitialis]|uniref:Uncharacterized protein n=1 Tax=Centaurea solstitialis TaxID=347529 RepID=A0AA38SPA7_9ASTR|nr:hypothetical protein OSB04_026622 [Centaurea solstitialis]
MGRAPCCDKANVKKGPWSPEEDRKLKEYIETHGTGGNWIALPQKAGLRRCGKSCRLRWLNYLRPNIKHGEFSDDEDKVICALFASIGSRWSIMAAQLPGRTDNDIKNYWNTKLKKKMMSSLISIPELRKPFQHHHLESFKSSTNYMSYPPSSLSIFQNSNNISAPLSSSSPPSSYLYNSTPTTTTTSTHHHHDHHHHHQTLSIPSSPTPAHGYNLGLGPMVVKDTSTLVMFGGSSTADQAASCSSNSDGSCHYDQYGGSTTVSVYDHNNYKEFGGSYEKEKGYYGDSSLDCSLEEIKQLISTNLCSSNIDNNLNFFADETKEVEKVIYY